MLPQLPQEFDAWNPNVSEGKHDESPEDEERDAILTFIDRLPVSIEEATELRGYSRRKDGRAIDDAQHEQTILSLYRASQRIS